MHNLSPFEGTNTHLECFRTGCSGEYFGLKRGSDRRLGTLLKKVCKIQPLTK